MAYRRSNGKGRVKKIEPAVMNMTFGVTLDPSESKRQFIDLSQCASLLNRRFYRQGINWMVAGIKINSSAIDGSGNRSNPVGTISARKLPSTWVFSNSWEKSMRAWQKMNNEALEESESVRPKFLDFKIYMNDFHHTAGYGANLLPIDSLGNTATAGEWSSSKIHVPIGVGAAAATNEFEFVGVGASYPGAGFSGLDAVSLVEGYAASRGLPDVLDPNAPADASDATGANPENWMAALFSEGTTQDSDVIEDMISENNIAPYPFENDGVNPDTMYPGGANQLPGTLYHDIEYITGTTIGGASYMKGGNFPCGLIEFGIANQSDTDNLLLQIEVDLVPGNHRGYLCESMMDM